MKVTVLPATPERWPDVEAIFGAKGCSVARGCWCMHYRHSGSAPSLSSVAKRSKVYRAGLKALVHAGRSPGLVAYRGERPVGWVSLAPREEFARLERSPVMKPVDDKPVWGLPFLGGSEDGASIFHEPAATEGKRTSVDDPVQGYKIPAAPGNRYVGLVLLFSTHDGAPLLICPDGVMQRMRVGATSAVAAKHMAKKNSKTATIIGSGFIPSSPNRFIMNC